MESVKEKKVLVSGASMAGLSTAYWMNKLGYQVTIVELANEPRVEGGAVDIKGMTIEVVKRMGIYEQLLSNALNLERIDFKNADDETVNSLFLERENEDRSADEIEIERDKFVRILLDVLNNEVEFIFNNSITTLDETEHEIMVNFKSGPERSFDLVFGCDGIHSGVRKIWFGHENDYSHFLGAYSSIIILNKLLVDQNTMQMYNVPNRGIMLNAYNNKTDLIFVFNSAEEIPYDYRDVSQQRKIILEKFAGLSWRTKELMEEVQHSKGFYFDKFCQIKMSSWTKGRVALVGDAGYCASPAAGMGASLAVSGAGALADALQKYDGNYKLAFQEYNENLRPFIEDVQAQAELNLRQSFIPKTEEAIIKRNSQGF